MGILTKILLICFFSQNSFAQNYQIDDGFYTGFDPTKIDESKFELDASKNKEEIPVEGKLYGYKFGGEEGFFIAPEAMRQLGEANNFNLDSSLANANAQTVDYNLKANMGYEFSNDFSTFISYNIGNISLNPAARNAAFVRNQGALGLGSQIKLADDFVIRITYSQQQVENLNSNQSRVNAEAVRFGTSINF